MLFQKLAQVYFKGLLSATAIWRCVLFFFTGEKEYPNSLLFVKPSCLATIDKIMHCHNYQEYYIPCLSVARYIMLFAGTCILICSYSRCFLHGIANTSDTFTMPGWWNSHDIIHLLFDEWAEFVIQLQRTHLSFPFPQTIILYDLVLTYWLYNLFEEKKMHQHLFLTCPRRMPSVA